MKRIIIPAMALLISACAKDSFGSSGSIPFYMEGTVRTEDSTPVKHIMVTVASEEGTAVVYTSAKGIFRTDGYIGSSSFPLTFTITLEDVDGEGNGGRFETLTDRLTVFKEDIGSRRVIKLSPDYLLTRATASENILPVL